MGVNLNIEVQKAEKGGMLITDIDHNRHILK